MIYSLVILDADLRTRAVCEQVLKSKTLSRIRLVGLATELGAGKKLLAKVKPDIVVIGDQLERGDIGGLLSDESFSPPPILIITATNDHYSIPALKKGAMDYLFKPLAKDELEKTLLRGIEKLTDEEIGEENGFLPITQKLLIKNAEGTFLVSKASIIRCQSEEGYTTIFCQGKTPTLVLAKTLKRIEAQLEEDRFVRVHQSHIINLDAIDDLETEESNMILKMVDGARVPVSHRRRSLLMSKFPSI
jgi:two-component system LytT family response regulator